MLCETNLLEAALDYARRGWCVFPLHGIVKERCTCGLRNCSSPGKHPLVRCGLHEATTDLDMIEEWWGRWPFGNIGIATRNQERDRGDRHRSAACGELS